jgi:hypothetical protein
MKNNNRRLIMDETAKAKLKMCSKCHNSYPATEENFRRDSRTRDGFGIYCKPCIRAMQRNPNKEYYIRTAFEKGVLGLRCPLWTDRCGHCDAINTCWRIVDDQPEDLPVKLVGKLAGSLHREGE